MLLDLAGAFPAGATGPRACGWPPTSRSSGTGSAGRSAGPTSACEPRRCRRCRRICAIRGYSEASQSAPGSPERPRYVLDGTAPRWRDLEGYHTRFGDVRELLRRRRRSLRHHERRRRDRAALRARRRRRPPGLVRDFVLVGDGWVKDGDFNTTLLAHRAAAADARQRPLHDAAADARGRSGLPAAPRRLRRRTTRATSRRTALVAGAASAPPPRPRSTR